MLPSWQYVDGILRELGAPNGSADGYVLLAKRAYQTGDAVSCSPSVSMVGFNAVFIECTVFDGADVPLFSIYVEVSNDRQNWTPLPLDTTPVSLDANSAGYYELDQSTIGQQISAAWVRLRYETVNDTKVIFSVGLDRKRLGA